MPHQSIEHKAREAELSHQLPNCTMSNHFPELLSIFFSLIESEISEQVIRQIATEELN